jgi:D-alanyl-D-alanine-carboxypeptidase/D-alanyl-D-alanine-endopeptidase
MRRIAVVAGFLALAAVTPARAAPAAPDATRPANLRDADIARLIRFRVDQQHRATSVVVGVLRRSGASIVAYGPTGRARKTGGDTVFEIASLSKIFTDLLLADAVVRGDARLDDPLSAYVPPGVKVPGFQDRAITLTDLATHTSALPLRPNNLNAAPDTPNKYASYTIGQLYGGLPDYRLTRPPGSKFEYSNLGVALLGQGLALHAHTTYASLLSARITGPLGLKDTRLGDDPAAGPRRAQGHDSDLKPVGSTDDGALNPAGGLRATANDLLKFLALFARDSGPGARADADGDLAKAARLMLTVDRPGDDPATRMALGWRRSKTGEATYYWSNGSGDGSRTFMGFNPARHIAVVALADAASGEGLDDIARRVLDPAQAVNLKIPAVHHEVQLPPQALDRLLGTYRYAPGDEFTLTRGITGLLLGAGPGQLVIYPEAPGRFFAKVADLQIDFDLPADGAPPLTLVLHQDGETFTYKRVP